MSEVDNKPVEVVQYDRGNKILYKHNIIDVKVLSGDQNQVGNVMQVDQITKTVYGGKQFWKVYLMDFLMVLGIIDSKQLDVFLYIVENTRATDNMFMGTYEEIGKAINVSKGTIAKIMKKLQTHNFIRMKYRSVWYVNPNILMKGSERKRQILLSYYEAEDPAEEATTISRGNRARIEEAPTSKPELEGQINMGDLPVWGEVQTIEERTDS